MSYRKLSTHPLHSFLRIAFARTAAGALGAAAPLAVLANPTGGQVVGGTATIGSAGANGVVVTQGSQKAIINWQQFSVGSGQYVQFVQPNSSSVVLNRVTGGNPSSIFGDIIANGQVFLVNTNGVYFAPGASIDVQGLVASTLDLNDSDFMQGRYVFSKAPGAPDAGVVNAGAIRTAPGGYVVLAGDYVNNGGAIVAQTGRVYLAAGNAATLTLDGDNLISYVVDGKTLSRLAGVTNTGDIAANGGLVVMTADVANALTATAVNNSGFIAAHSVTEHGGEIVLEAQGGDIENSGTLDASAINAGMAGGAIVIRGDGETKISSGAVVETQGDQAKGGFIELSGHGLTVRGLVDSGRGGTILLDPSKIKLVAGSAVTNFSGATVSVGTAYVLDKLNSGQNVTLVASNSIGHASNVTALNVSTRPGTGAGNLTIKTGTLAPGAGSLAGSIQCSQGGACVPGAATKFTPMTGTIALGGMNINIRGAFTADAVTGSVTVANVIANGGISLTGSQITAGSLSAAAGNVVITGKQALPASGATTTITQTGTITGRNVTISENIPGGASYGGNINIGNVHATAGSISIAAITTATNQGMNITVGNLTASKAVEVRQQGHNGSIRLGSISAGGTLASHGHAAVYVNSIITGTGNGGTISAGTITAHHGGVQVSANDTNGSGASVHLGNISAPYISVSATARGRASIAVGALNATGTGAASVSKDISLFAHATGPGSSPSFLGSARGNITVNGNITGPGKLTIDAFGGSDSGAIVTVRNPLGGNGNINMAGSVNILAVNDGLDGAQISLGNVAGKFVDIEARATNTHSQSSNAQITINGNVVATGTAPSGSPNRGVTIDAGSSHARNGAPQITVTGNITASHGAVNLNLWGGGLGGRSIDVGQSVSGVWTSGAIKAQQVNIQAHGSASGAAVRTGNITAAGGKVSIVASGKSTSGVDITVGNVTAQSVSMSDADKLGGSASISAGKIAAAKISVSATAPAATGQAAHITLGSIHGVSAAGGASINVNAVGSTTSVAFGPISVGGALSIKSKSALDLSSTTIKSGKGMTLQAASLNLSNTVITAGSFSASAQAANGSLALTGATLTAAKASLQAGGNIDLTSADVHVAGDMALKAGKDVILSGVSMNVGGILSAKAGGSIHNGGTSGSITANGLALTAGKNINLSSTQITVGNGSLASVGSDPVLIGALAGAQLLTPGVTRPNAYFNAGGTLSLGKFTLTGSYLYMKAANITLLGPVSTPAGSVIQFVPVNGTDSIGVEQDPGTGSVMNLSNSLLLSLFPGTTLVLGDKNESGAVTLGSNGPFDIGSSNLVIYTTGTVTGLDLVTSTGLVTTVQSLLATALPPPTPDEIDPNSNNNNNEAGRHHQQGDYDPNGGTAGGGTISQSTDAGGACH